MIFDWTFINFIVIYIISHVLCSDIVFPGSGNEGRSRGSVSRSVTQLEGICGISHNTRIVGGVEADPKAWQWMSALITKTGKSHYCGGVLITFKHIITAAHCLTGQTPSNMLVRLGAYDFSDDVDPVAKDYEAANFKIHSHYDKISHTNDIAIITLKKEAKFTDIVRPICLPEPRRSFFGSIATVVGWGSTEYGGQHSSKLREVSLPIWNNTDCKAAYSQEFTDKIMCAGFYEGGKDTCQGDSGGPLMLLGSNRRWVLVGIVSWGYRCGEPGFPGVYTRINKYLDWIEENLKDKREPSSDLIIKPKPENWRALLRKAETNLHSFMEKSYNGKLMAQQLMKKISQLPNNAKDNVVQALAQQINDYITPPNWFLNQTKLCMKWSPDGNYEQCSAISRNLCAEPNKYTPFYKDNTESRKGCRMKWGITTEISANWFKKVKICYQWYPEGDSSQCGGGAPIYNCAPVGEYTIDYLDLTSGIRGGCLMSWSLYVPQNAPGWALNLRLCFKWSTDGQRGQCSSVNQRQTICAFANKWTDFYKDNTDSRPGGCKMSWALITINHK